MTKKKKVEDLKAPASWKGLITHIATVLISLGVVGGGGYVGLNSLDTVTVELRHTNETLMELKSGMGEDLEEVRKQLSVVTPRLEDISRLEEEVGKLQEQIGNVTPREWTVKIQEKVNRLTERMIRLETQMERMKERNGN